MKKLLIAITSALLLTACGSTEDSKETKETKTVAKQQDTNILSEYGKVTEYYNKQNLSYKATTGPIEFEITGVNVSDIKPSEENSFIFNNAKNAHIVILTLNAKNTTKDEVWFGADYPVLVTDTGEQVDVTAHEVSKEVGGDFKGEVSKNGRVLFFLEKDIKDIKKITLHFDAPVDKGDNELGDKKKIVIPLK